MDSPDTTDLLPLSTLASQSLVAFAIEFDNEFEHRMPHRTTRHGSTPGAGRAPWLVSMAMWQHCMRHIPEDGITAGELTRRARLTGKSMQTVLKRMGSWWGYLTVEPDPAAAKPPKSAWLVRATPAGRQAQREWGPLTEIIEERWRTRFDDDAVERLRASLLAVVDQFDVELPDYLPVGEARLGPRPAASAREALDPSLPALLSKLLLALALDFDLVSDLSLDIYTSTAGSRLAIGANILRVLDGEGVRVADIPSLTGVAKMAIDNWLGSLEEHRYLTIGADPTGGRLRVARLTQRGLAAREQYVGWADTIDLRWSETFGEQAVRDLRATLEPLVAAGTPESPLWRGIEPYPDGWRAQVRRPGTLPHYPMVSARGGFPDGN